MEMKSFILTPCDKCSSGRGLASLPHAIPLPGWVFNPSEAQAGWSGTGENASSFFFTLQLSPQQADLVGNFVC